MHVWAPTNFESILYNIVYLSLPANPFFKPDWDLVGGIPTPLNNMKVNGKDDIPYFMETKIHVWNHQPEIDWVI